MTVTIRWFPRSWVQIKAGDKTIYHAGDTSFIPEMRELGEVDVALLPIDGKFRMDIDEAVEAAMAIKSAFVIPVHRFDANPQELAEKVEGAAGIKGLALEIGEAYHLEG
jgi:L-ascorbate metabolism protein UlaG (beta-lactamase superfamily)